MTYLNDFPVRIPLAEHLGFRLGEFSGGRAEIFCDLKPELCNSYGSIHGGTIMALIDIAMIHAARSPSSPGEDLMPPCVTVNMNTSFIRPALGPLTAHARLVSEPNTLAFCEVTVTDRNGEICARGNGTLRYMKTRIANPHQ